MSLMQQWKQRRVLRVAAVHVASAQALPPYRGALAARAPAAAAIV